MWTTFEHNHHFFANAASIRWRAGHMAIPAPHPPRCHLLCVHSPKTLCLARTEG